MSAPTTTVFRGGAPNAATPAGNGSQTLDPAALRPTTFVRGRSITYVPALDGLRAVAVGGVLLYHAGVDWMPGGYLGVDAFFVLSGFLITSLLVEEWMRTGRIAFRAFWARRARRLLPALFLVLAGIVVYAAAFARAAELSSLRQDALASLAYVANWRFAFSDQGYFDQFAAPSLLRHMWSLAIEEQFYFVWPVVLLGLLHVFRTSFRQLALTVGALAGLSLTTMLWLYETGTDPSRVYYGTDTRAQSLLIGAFVAIAAGGVPVLARRTRFVAHSVALVAVGLLAWMWCTAGEDVTWLYNGGLTVAAVAVASVIVSVTQPRVGPVGTLLSFSPLVWVGRISYGLYLWHWPIFLVMTPDRTGLDGTRLVLARIGASVAFASASYYLVERPIRFGRARAGRAWAFAPVVGTVVVAAVLVAGIVVTTTGGGAGSASAALAALSEAENANVPPVSAPPATTGSSVEPARPPTRVMVVGDSVALTMMFHLDKAPDNSLWVWNRAALGCGIAQGDHVVVGGELKETAKECEAVRNRWPQDLAAFDPNVVVVLVGAWEVLDHKVDGRLLRAGTPEYGEWVLGRLRAATTVLGSTGAQVVFLTTPYFDADAVPRDPSKDWSEFEPWRVDALNQIFRELVATSGAARLIDLNRYVSPDGKFTDTLDGMLIRYDGLHFTLEGSAHIARWLGPQLEALSAPRPTVR